MAEASGQLYRVESMLDEMTPRQMDALVAYDRVHGVGLMRLIRILVNGFVELSLRLSGDVEKESVQEITDRIDDWNNDGSGG